jgi:hypothetical protein
VKDKNRTTASKPLPKPVSKRMYAVVLGDRLEVDLDELCRTGLWNRDHDAIHGGLNVVPVLVTVTPIRAKRARKGMR